MLVAIDFERMMKMMKYEMESDPDHVVYREFDRESHSNAIVVCCVDSMYRICQYSIIRTEESVKTHYACI